MNDVMRERAAGARRVRRRDRGRSVAAALAVTVAVLPGVLAACSSSDDEAGDAEAATPTVRLLTYDSFALPEAAAAAFEERYGARIEVVATGDSGSMLTGALLSAGDPEADVIFGIDDTSATRALSEPLLDPVDPSTLEAVPEQYLLAGDGADLLVPIDTGDVCMNLDASWFAEQGLAVPTTLEQLTEPAYRDLVVVPSPVTSSPGLALLIGTVDRFGEDGWRAYWAALEANGVRVRPSWDDAYYSDYTVSGGDRPIVLSYASSPPAEVVFSEGERTEPASTVMLDSCTSQVEYAGVLAGTPEPELAQQLVAFMVDETWQRELPLTNFVFPVLDVELPAEFEQWAPRAEDPMGLEPEVIDQGRDRWIETWREQME